VHVSNDDFGRRAAPALSPDRWASPMPALFQPPSPSLPLFGAPHASFEPVYSTTAEARFAAATIHNDDADADGEFEYDDADGMDAATLRLFGEDDSRLPALTGNMLFNDYFLPGTGTHAWNAPAGDAQPLAYNQFPALQPPFADQTLWSFGPSEPFQPSAFEYQPASNTYHSEHLSVLMMCALNAYGMLLLDP
jgi:hypothetical protein